MAKKKESKIRAALTGISQVQKDQILAEIRSIRINSAIAILGVIGAAVSFVVVQHNNIKDLLYVKPKLSIICDDVFAARSSKVRISDARNNKEVYESDLKNIAGQIELPEGSYKLVVLFGGKTIWDESFELIPNGIRNIELPRFFQNRIDVFVEAESTVVEPGHKIDLSINSSGNGYLWIFELVDGKTLKMLFPSTNDMEKKYNEVRASSKFEFPESSFLGAGMKEKSEKYLFLVTSLNDQSYAQEIVNGMYGADIDKGDIRSIEKNWGIGVLDIQVKR